MKQFRLIMTIAKKEWLTYFQSSTGYILIVPFLLLTFFLYFRSAFISNQASLRPFFELLPMILLVLAPAIAMRTFSQEQKNKTLELLFAHPVTETHIVVGKFLGSLGFFMVVLATTISLPLTVFAYSSPDPGVVLAQYLGALFVGGAFLAIGIAAAVVTSSQVASFLLGAFISFLLILVGLEIVLLSLPSFLSLFVAELAILPHAVSMSRGLIDLRDLLYFLTIIGVALTIAVIRLSHRKTVEDKTARLRLNMALVAILGIGVVLNIFMHSFPLRLDITAKQIFTLSQGTRQTLQALPDVVTIKLFTSTNLPGPILINVRNTRDTLKDYQRYSQGKIKIEERQPDINPADKSTAAEIGIQEVQFNTLANNSFAVQNGYFGVSIHFGNQTEVLPFLQSTDDLEYQLTRRIRKLIAEEKPSLSIYSQAEGAFGRSSSVQILTQALETQYDVQPVDLTLPKTSINSSALLVYDIQEPLGATAAANLKQFVESGGNIVLLLSNHTINPQAGSATSFKTGLEDWLKTYGITVNQDLVFDAQLNETVSLQNGPLQYVLPYPFWIRALPVTKDFVGLGGVQSLALSWASSLTLSSIEGVTHVPLLQTSPKAGKQSGKYNLTPGKLSPEDLMAANEQLLVGVALEKGDTKLVVVGDSDFITDDFMRNHEDNLNFTSNILDWVATDAAAASIPKKTADSSVFNFKSPAEVAIAQYGNILLPPLMVIVFAIWYLNRRKLLAQRAYTNG